MGLLGDKFYMGTQNESKLEIWWDFLNTHSVMGVATGTYNVMTITRFAIAMHVAMWTFLNNFFSA